MFKEGSIQKEVVNFLNSHYEGLGGFLTTHEEIDKTVNFVSYIMKCFEVPEAYYNQAMKMFNDKAAIEKAAA